MTTDVDIKDKSGNIIFSTPINVGSKKKFTLMKEDYITLKFSVKDPILFSLGDGISYDDIGDYELVSPYKPTYNTSTGGYDYELQLDAYYRKWKNKILKYSTSNKGGETSFSLTATIDIHLNVILRSIASYGYNYRGTAFTYQVDSSELDKSSEAMLVEYDSTNIIEALNKLCAEDKWNCEWWVTGSVIHVGKCENGTSVNLELGKNIEKMERSDSKTEYATRYFVFGGTTNVPETYRKSLIFKVTKLNGMSVLDENRTLRASYFQDSDKLTNTYHTSALDDSHAGEYISTSEAEYTKDISVGTLDAGTYAVNLSSLILKASETLGTAIDLYFKGSFTCEVNLVCDGIDKKVFFGTMNVTDRDNMSMTVDHTEDITLTSSANAVLRIKMSIGYNYSTKNPITFTIKGGESITSVGKGAKCTLTFLSGTLKGQTVQGVYNSNYEVESSNQYITLTSQAAVGDTFTIDNILKPMVPSSYFTADDDEVVKDGVVTKRLMLPLATPYIDSVPGLNEEQLVEKVLVLDDVYPRMHDEKLTDVKSEICDETDDKGNKTGKTFPQYTITDDKITTFKPSYIQSGKTLGITFMTGLLSGMTFDAKLLSGADKPLQITIIRNNNYGRYLPDEVIKPAVGDEYVLTNYNVEFMSTTLVSDAEAELYTKAKEKIAKLSIDGSTYSASMMSDNAKTLYDAGTKTILPIGQKVKLINPGFFSAGRDSRVLGYELALDIPFDTPQFTIGETYEYSRLSSMEEKIESMTYKGSTYSNVTVIGGSGSTYLITKDDATSPSDSNTFSALRVLKEISDRGHTHENKAILDNLTQSVIDNSHTHTNKATLDVIDQSLSTASAVKFAKVTATDAELGTIKATTGDFSGAVKAAAATIIGLITCATLNADAATIPTISSTNINASTQVVSPLFVGHLQGNADTATRFKDTFKLWGQDFYGNNVNGNAVFGMDSDFTLNSGITIKEDNGIEASLFLWQNGVGSAKVGFRPNDRNLYIANTYSDGKITNPSCICIADDGKVGIGTTSPYYKLDVNGTMRVADTAIFDGNIGTATYISQSQGWRVTNAGNADFRTIYTDELHATAFTADVSQALAGSDYLTKSVSKLSANFVVPAVGSSVRIIVDDLEGFPATACFENGDYIRFRAFNRTSGLTISDAWGTVTLDTTFGTSGFSSGTQAYIYTVTSAAVTGISVYKGSEVLDYGKSSDGLIVRTTLDKNNSPYSQIATWVNDPSNSANYTVHARLGKLSGIAHCSGYGLYTDNAFLTNSIVVGDLTKANNYLSYNPADGLVVKGNLYVSSGAVASTSDVNTAVNNVQVGGRNLLLNSNFSKGIWSGWGGTRTIVSDDKFGKAIQMNGAMLGDSQSFANKRILSTDIVTLSFWAKADKNMTCSTQISNGDSSKLMFGFRSFNVTTSWQKYIFTTTSGIDSDDSINIYVYATETALFANFKIELGNKATDWTPAPEDVDASIATKVATTTYDAKMTLIDSAIISKVSQTDFNALGQRVSSAESSITQLPNTIDARITTQVQAGGSIYSAVATSLTMTSDGISLFGKNIQLSGAVTFVSSLNQTAQGYANTAQNNLAVKIGYASYDAMVAQATAGNTIINGAYIRTTLIESVAVLTEGLKAHKILADDIDTTSITSSTAFVNSLTANTAFISNLKTNIVNAAYVNTLSLNAAAIKVGTIDTDRMNASDIVTKGLQAKTIDAMNATIQNITVTNATISGTLNGVTGTFTTLTTNGGGIVCKDASGSEIFSLTSSQFYIQAIDMQHQGTYQSRSLRFLSSNIRCRSAFGSLMRNTAKVIGNRIYYYVNGDSNTYVCCTLSSTTYSGVTYYIVPLYPSSSMTLYSSSGASLSDLNGFPVDVVIFNNPSEDYRYWLVGTSTEPALKTVKLINASSAGKYVYIATAGAIDFAVKTHSACDLYNMGDSMTPSHTGTSIGSSRWIPCGYYESYGWS